MFIYVHVVSSVINKEVIVRARLYTSLRKNNKPHKVQVLHREDETAAVAALLY